MAISSRTSRAGQQQQQQPSGGHAALRPEHHHRDIQGGAARAAVFGVSDGLVSNVALVLGVAGAASAQAGFVRVAGLTGLIAGAISMAAGEFVSMKAQRELFERELDMERREIHRRPDVEQAELAAIYEGRGVQADTAMHLAGEMMRDPELALETHAREELGIDPGALGSPWQASLSSFICFALGAIIPVIPWFFSHGTAAIAASLVLAATAAIVVGTVLSQFTGRSRLYTATRQLLFAMVPAGITYGLGSALEIGATSVT